MKRKLNLDLTDKLHSIYLRSFSKPMRYNIFFGGKWTGKSWAIALVFIFKFISSDKKDALVLRKYNKDHTISTYKTLKKAISIIDGFTSVVGHNFKGNFKFTKSPTPEIIYLKTGRKIMFAGMDDPGRVAGITTDDPNAFIGLVWYEEPIEVADLKTVSKLEQQVLAMINFEVVEDSALRPPIELENENLEIFFTMNSWRLLTSWIYDKFNRLFSTFNYDDIPENVEDFHLHETINALETDGYILKEDPNYLGGQGLRICHTSYKVLENMGLLEKKQIIKHQSRREFNTTEYLQISLGIPERDETFIFKKYEHDILREIPNMEERVPIMMGLDVGQLKDYTALEVVTTDIRYNWDTKKDDENLEYLVFDGEKKIKEKSLITQAKIIVDYILDVLLLKNDRSEFYMKKNGFIILIHKEADFKMIEPLYNEIKSREIEIMEDLKWIKLQWAPTTNTAKNRIGQRLEKWKALILSDRLVISHKNPALFSTLISTEIDSNGNRIEDKRVIDFLNAAEHPLNKLYLRLREYAIYTQYENKEIKID